MKKLMLKKRLTLTQLKVLAEKIKAMSEYAPALIDEANEHTRKTSKRIKAIVAKREEQSQAQETILKAISKMAKPHRT